MAKCAFIIRVRYVMLSVGVIDEKGFCETKSTSKAFTISPIRELLVQEDNF